jgi:surface antigen
MTVREAGNTMVCHRVALNASEVRQAAAGFPMRMIGPVSVTALLGLALALGGCSMAISPIGSDSVDSTGSITPVFRSPLSGDLSQEDWRRAKGALAVALDPQGNGSSVSWDNPESGLKGTFVPVGSPFVQNDIICRAFVATLTGAGDTPVSLQGSACRPSPDEWEVSGVKPWRRPA